MEIIRESLSRRALGSGWAHFLYVRAVLVDCHMHLSDRFWLILDTSVTSDIHSTVIQGHKHCIDCIF